MVLPWLNFIFLFFTLSSACILAEVVRREDVSLTPRPRERDGRDVETRRRRPSRILVSDSPDPPPNRARPCAGNNDSADWQTAPRIGHATSGNGLQQCALVRQQATSPKRQTSCQLPNKKRVKRKFSACVTLPGPTQLKNNPPFHSQRKERPEKE